MWSKTTSTSCRGTIKQSTSDWCADVNDLTSSSSLCKVNSPVSASIASLSKVLPSNKPLETWFGELRISYLHSNNSFLIPYSDRLTSLPSSFSQLVHLSISLSFRLCDQCQYFNPGNQEAVPTAHHRSSILGALHGA